jgi:uncharacterized membrane protein (DUF373 family)
VANILADYKKIVVYTVMAMIGFIILLIVLSLTVDIMVAVTDKDLAIVSKQDVLKFIGNFLLIVVCIELLDTMLAYTRQQEIHVEIVILVALTAVARELIVFDYEKVDSMILIGIGAAVISLSTSYFLIRRSRHKEVPKISE